MRDLCASPPELGFLYDLDAGIEEKIRTIATRVYGASGVELTTEAKKASPGLRFISRTHSARRATNGRRAASMDIGKNQGRREAAHGTCGVGPPPLIRC